MCWSLAGSRGAQACEMGLVVRAGCLPGAAVILDLNCSGTFSSTTSPSPLPAGTVTLQLSTFAQKRVS